MCHGGFLCGLLTPVFFFHTGQTNKYFSKLQIFLFMRFFFNPFQIQKTKRMFKGHILTNSQHFLQKSFRYMSRCNTFSKTLPKLLRHFNHALILFTQSGTNTPHTFNLMSLIGTNNYKKLLEKLLAQRSTQQFSLDCMFAVCLVHLQPKDTCIKVTGNLKLATFLY